MKTNSKVILGLVVIVSVILITNPNVKDFKDYLGQNSYYGLQRTSNLFIFSRYKFQDKSYFGAVGNFWETKAPKAIAIDSVATTDSAVSGKMDTARFKVSLNDTLIQNPNAVVNRNVDRQLDSFIKAIKKRKPHKTRL